VDTIEKQIDSVQGHHDSKLEKSGQQITWRRGY
jgi:hypothetical protein